MKGFHAHPHLLFKQATGPPAPLSPPSKPLLAPKSGSFAKGSLTLNIHSSGVEKANSGKVQDWRQSEPHVRNSFLITGNALAHCIKMLWLMFLFLRGGLGFLVHLPNVLFPPSAVSLSTPLLPSFSTPTHKTVLSDKFPSLTYTDSSRILFTVQPGSASWVLLLKRCPCCGPLWDSSCTSRPGHLVSFRFFLEDPSWVVILWFKQH